MSPSQSPPHRMSERPVKNEGTHSKKAVAKTAPIAGASPAAADASGRPCAWCGNVYDKAFEIRLADGSTYVFDCFECAIHRAAVACEECGCRIIGHGLEADGLFYCCAHCAKRSGQTALRDRAGG